MVTNREAYLKLVMKPNFKSGVLFGENLIGCKMGKIKVVMNKPVYLEQAILDLSKIVMYEFHYDYMAPKYGKKLDLCYMDTDSLIYNIEMEDFYKDIVEDVPARFDTSGYNPDRLLPVGLNKKVIGLMKDKLGGEILTEFVTLRPKMYAYRKGSAESKKCKGIKKCTVRKTISFEDYKACLFGGGSSYRSQSMFRSLRHEVKTLEVNKLALSRDVEVSEIRSKDFNYKSIRFAYDGGEVPPIRVDGNLGIFKSENKNGPAYSLVINCTGDNESFFRKLNSALANQSCKILKDHTVTPENFELVKENKYGCSVFAKIYCNKSGKTKLKSNMAWVPSLICKHQCFFHCGIIMSCMAAKVCTLKVFRP